MSDPESFVLRRGPIKTNSCICGDLVEDLGLAQPTISQHLKELKNAGLIQGKIEGASVCYCINPKIWKQYQQFFNDLFINVKVFTEKECC